MKKRISMLIAFGAALLISSLTYAQTREDLKKTFTNLNNKMIEAGKAENYEAMRQFYMEDAISLPSYEPMIRGYNNILESHRRMKEAGAKVNDMQFVITDVMSSGDLAVEIGTYMVDMTMPGMGQIKDYGKYMTVWKKQKDGSWKVAAETWNTDQNIMAQPGGEGPSLKGEPTPAINPSEPGGIEMKPQEAPKSSSRSVINTSGNSVILKSSQSNDQGQKPQSTTTTGSKEKK